MDNITHSLTGALAAKIVETNYRGREPHLNVVLTEQDAESKLKAAHRTLFWLTVVCANLPDIDVLLNLSGDPFFTIKHHRGLTHSLLFAPVLAFLPAIVAYLFTSFKNLKALWLMALVGVYLHIAFDLVTTFGTQLFAPLSAERYSLDWMFIIDPLFTGILALLLFLGKKFKHHAKGFALAGGLFVISYLALEMLSHNIAYKRVSTTARQEGIIAARVSALPQPLSLFRWMGVVQTGDGVHVTFFSVFDNPEPPIFTKFSQARDEFVKKALQTEEAEWFMRFARHPLVQSKKIGETRIVEMRDHQFYFNPELVNTLGNLLGVAESERRMPFTLQFEFSRDGELLATRFNR